MPVVITCQECGEERSVPPSQSSKKYCSKACYEVVRKRQSTKKCETCGKDFFAKIQKGERAKFCSFECHHESMRLRKTLECKHCGKEFERPISDKTATYCSIRCRSHDNSAEVECGNCGRLFRSQNHRFESGRGKFCSRKCADEGKTYLTGENHPNYKGRVEHSDGYVRLRMPDHHLAGEDGYVMEHRIVMEEKLGRKLKEGEVVHHINYDKADNSPENLMVFKNDKEHAEWHWKHDERLKFQLSTNLEEPAVDALPFEAR